MKALILLVKKVSTILDILAGVCMLSVMLLIVSNIILRVGFNRPILGTYELVGFLTATGVGLALAHCAFQDGHIAVSFIMDRFPKKFQLFIDVLMNSVSLVFWGMVTWYLVNFAQSMMLKGLVSPSAEIPVYPFIYLIGLGIFGLCAVLLLKLVSSFREVMAEATKVTIFSGFKIPDSAKRAAR